MSSPRVTNDEMSVLCARAAQCNDSADKTKARFVIMNTPTPFCKPVHEIIPPSGHICLLLALVSNFNKQKLKVDLFNRII